MVGDIPFSLVSIEKKNYTFKDGSQVPSMVTDCVNICVPSESKVVIYAQKTAFVSAKSTQGEEHQSYLGLLLHIGTTKVLAHFPT